MRTATLLRSGRSGVCILVGVRYVSSPKRPDRIWSHPASYYTGTGVLSWGLTTHPSSAKVKNEWSYTSPPHIRLHGVDKEILPLYTTYQLSLIGHKERYVLVTKLC